MNHFLLFIHKAIYSKVHLHQNLLNNQLEEYKYTCCNSKLLNYN